ncbi:MAG: PIN domain-containing protein, partial [Thioalkalivibrio sp.]
YGEGIGDEHRCELARLLVEKVPGEQVVLPAQTLGELFRVLTGKGGRKQQDARLAVLSWADCFEVADSTWSSFQSAFDLSADHGLQIWDALIMSVAAESRCRLLLSEDFQDGFTYRGVTVVNPFSTSPDVLLEGVLRGKG